MRRHPGTGQIAHGIAGDGVYVDGRQIAPGNGQSGMPDWMGDQVLHCAEAGVTLRQADGSTPMVVGVPAAFVRASASGWAAWHDKTGVVASWGLKLPAAVLLDMAPDGTLLVGDNYQSGIGLSAYRTGSLTPLWRVTAARPALFFPYAQAAVLDETTACWTENIDGHIALVGHGLPEGPRPPWNTLHPRLFRVNGDVWVVYLRSEDDMTIAHPWDYQGLGFSVPGFGYGPEASSDGATVTIYWSVGAGERAGDIRTKPFNLSALEEIPPLPAPPPPPVDHFGPIGDPEPDGASFRMADYVFGPDFTRTGTHPMQQVTRPEGRYLVKFGQPQCYELWATTPNGDVHHLEDASAGDRETYRFTSTLWCYATMKVGRAFGYMSKPHEAVFFHPSTKREFNRVGFVREMWLWRAWATFNCGPDQPTLKRVVVMVYDPTNGAHTDPAETDPSKIRGIELFYFAEGLGWIGWEYHHSGRVYATATARFDDTTRLARSMFYRNGGPSVQPRPTGLAATPTEEIPPMRDLTTAERATVDAFAANNPLPHFPASQGDAPESWQDVNLRYAPNGWIYKLAQQMAFSHDPRWGQKRRNSGTAISNGQIALRDTGTNFHAYDLLEAAATGRPKLLGGNGSYYYVDDGQEWVAVPPFDHLGGVKPRPGRAPWPAEAMHGLSGFDAAPRMEIGDTEYYDHTAPLPLNCFVYTTIDSPQTHRIGRTFAQGLVQTEMLLKRLAADGRRAMFIMICGPANVNNGPKPTRAEILDMVRQEVSLFERYPRAVLALKLGNELYQGFEPPELLDPTLWAEVEALIPLQFPFAIGQVGDVVVFGPGSFAVMHNDRGKSSLEAMQILATAQTRTGLTVVAREPARIEAGGSGQSRGDIAFVVEELANAKRLNIPYFLHLAAGRGAFVPAMGDVEHQALALIKAAAEDVTPPTPPTPGHDILDVYLPGANDDGLSPEGYRLFEVRRKDIEALAVRWYELSRGHKPGDSDISVGVYIQGMGERRRWKTLRTAWRNGWPLPAGVQEPS